MSMTSAPSSLDVQFGECKEPGQVGQYEARFVPSSCFHFNKSTAGRLRAIAATLDAELKISHCLYTDFTVIWLVNDVGALLIALDEVITDDEQHTFPLPRAVGSDARFRERKLGHPSLVHGNAARIGGELNYEAVAGLWYLTNKSGRYGVNCGRTPLQLNEVAKIFEAQGFPVRQRFQGPVKK